MNNTNISDSHDYTLAIQEIKEQVIYMTEILKGDRNFLNKHFQNAITNYFMEDYASLYLKDKMNLKTYKEVKNVMQQKLDERKKQENSGTKYMNLINIYYEEHTNKGTLELYQEYLRQLAFSNEDKNYAQGTQEWVTISWKKATALFVLHHSQNTSLSSIFEIWNSLFPEDPIIKKKKTKEERDKERLREQIKENETGNFADPTSVKKAKKGIQKNKAPVDRQSFNKQKDIQLWRKNNKKVSPRNSDQEENNHDYDNNSEEKDSHNSNSENKDLAKLQAVTKKRISNNNNKGKNAQEEQEANELVESLVDVKDSIHLFKEKIISENNGEGFDAFPDFVYTPINAQQDLHNNNPTAQSIVVQHLDQEKIKEEYQNCSMLSGMDIEQSKDKDAIFKSLILAKGLSTTQQQQNNQTSNANLLLNHLQASNLQYQKPFFESEDFFTKDMNIFQDNIFGDINNELQMFESQKNAHLKVNFPIFNSLTISAMNINNNNNLNLFSNNNLNATFQQQNPLFGSRKLYNQFIEEQQVTNSLQFFRISDKNEQKNAPNQSFQVEFDKQGEEQDQNRLMFDLGQTEDSLYHSNKIKLPCKQENDINKEYNEDEKQNEEGIREIKEFLNHINALPTQSQKLREFIANNSNNQKSSDTCTSSMENTQSESNTYSSSNNTGSNLINSNQYYLKNLSQHQFV